MKNDLRRRERTRASNIGGPSPFASERVMGVVRSPYFQVNRPTRRIGADGIRLLILKIMAVNKAVAVTFLSFNQDVAVDAQFYDGSTWVDEYNLELGTSTYTDPASMQAQAESLILSYASAHGYTGLTSASQIIWPLKFPSSAPTLAFANPTRSLNSAFQISTTSNALVSYTVDIAASLSLSGGATGTVTLEYADDSGMSTNLKTVQSSVNGNAGTLTLGLGLTQTATAALGGVIPAGKYVKIVTANTTGTPTFTMRAAQEVLI